MFLPLEVLAESPVPQPCQPFTSTRWVSDVTRWDCCDEAEAEAVCDRSSRDKALSLGGSEGIPEAAPTRGTPPGNLWAG